MRKLGGVAGSSHLMVRKHSHLHVGRATTRSFGITSVKVSILVAVVLLIRRAVRVAHFLTLPLVVGITLFRREEAMGGLVLACKANTCP